MKRAILDAEKVVTCHLTASEPHREVLKDSYFWDQSLQFQGRLQKAISSKTYALFDEFADRKLCQC